MDERGDDEEFMRTGVLREGQDQEPPEGETAMEVGEAEEPYGEPAGEATGEEVGEDGDANAIGTNPIAQLNATSTSAVGQTPGPLPSNAPLGVKKRKQPDKPKKVTKADVDAEFVRFMQMHSSQPAESSTRTSEDAPTSVLGQGLQALKRRMEKFLDEDQQDETLISLQEVVNKAIREARTRTSAPPPVATPTRTPPPAAKATPTINQLEPIHHTPRPHYHQEEMQSYGPPAPRANPVPMNGGGAGEVIREYYGPY